MAAVTDFEKLIATYITQLEELEVAFFQLVNDRTLETSVGLQLDGIGQIVGEDRLGRNDDDYRIAVKGRIRLNLSNGTTEDIIAIILSQIGDEQVEIIEDSYPAHFEAFIFSTIDSLMAFVVAGISQSYALSHLDNLVVSIDAGASQNIVLNAADFADISKATAAEVAAAIDPSLSGASAIEDFGRVSLRSDTLGDVSAVQVLGGTANAILGFDFGNLTLATTLSGAAETSVVVIAAIPLSAPDSGTLSIELDSGAYVQVAYSSFSGSTFTIPATDFSTDNSTTPKIVVIAIEHTGEEANQALMIRVSRSVQEARGAGIRGILLWNTCTESFGFAGTPGALGFGQGCFASALDV